MLEPTNPCFLLYRSLAEYIESHQEFRSVLSGSIRASTEGLFGNEVPEYLSQVRAGTDSDSSLFLWPLMGMLWAFDPEVVAKRCLLDYVLLLTCFRSLICGWVKTCSSSEEHFTVKKEGRKMLAKR